MKRGNSMRRKLRQTGYEISCTNGRIARLLKCLEDLERSLDKMGKGKKK